MINGNLEQFLDTGWYMESTLFLRGFVYWCEAQTNSLTKITRFFVYRWRAETTDNRYYHEQIKNGDVIDFEFVLDIYHNDIDNLKKQFLLAPIFDGKSFWEVESEIAWLDEGEPIYLVDK